MLPCARFSTGPYRIGTQTSGAVARHSIFRVIGDLYPREVCVYNLWHVETYMTTLRPSLRYLVLAAICLPFLATGVSAQDDQAFLTYRQKVMQSIGGNMGAISAIMKNQLPYQNNIAAHARGIQIASMLIESAFKKQITEGRTDAKPDIWQDWNKFVAAAHKLRDESRQLAVVAQSGDMAAIGAQVKAVGKSCGGCHKPFRKPKEERFKR